MNGMKHPMENSELQRQGLERGIALVRMVRRSSQDLRKKLSWRERDSTWKVSLLTGQTAALPSNSAELLEVNYEDCDNY